MGYKVHRLEIDIDRDAAQLEAFLDGLEGDVVSIVPLFKRISLAQIYGATSRTKGVVVVEKV